MKLIRTRKKDQRGICIFTFPFASWAGIFPLSNLVEILKPLSDHLYLIMGNTGYALFRKKRGIHTYRIKHKKGTNPFTRVINYTLTQLKISFIIMKLRRNVDFYLSFISSITLTPILTAKLLGKNVISMLPASQSEISRAQKDIFSKFLKLLEQINYIFSDRIVVYSERLIGAYDLEKYRSKISLAHQHLINFNKFKVVKRLPERSNLVGYIGRLSEEKGILNFVRAIPKILDKKQEVRFLIGGNGQLREKIQEYINKEWLNDKVEVLGWIPHGDLPTYLNELKLLVLPSCTEGLPLIMLEAMSCGTPVLVTPVGGIPDVIKDGETGFLMEDNSPECIAGNVIRTLDHPDIEEITKNALVLVNKEFTYEKAVESYKHILKTVF